MKTLLLLALAGAFLALAPLAGRAAEKPAPAPESLPPSPPPKSVFVIDPKFGRDPFFPRSERWTNLFPKVTNEVAVAQPPPPQFPEELRCQGFSAVGAKKLVIINGRTVEAGEKFVVRLLSGQTIQVLCLEIRDGSAVVEVNGIAKELHLRSDLK